MRPIALCLMLLYCAGAQAESHSFAYLSSPEALNVIFGAAVAHADFAGAGAVAFAASAVTGMHSTVPEPQTFLQILAGLGLLAFMAQRRFRDESPFD